MTPRAYHPAYSRLNLAAPDVLNPDLQGICGA